MTQDEQRQYDKAVAFATQKHEGQTRAGGEPYVSHPIAVAQIVKNWGYGLPYQLTALFHDLLEDTNATESEILALGGEEVLHAVKLLTKQKGYVMAEYISAIQKNPIAFVIKAADRLHNLQCATCTAEAFKRKYIRESVEWYLPFCKEIPVAVQALAKTLDTPMEDFPFLLQPIENWPISQH